MLDKSHPYKIEQNKIFDDNETHLMGFVKWLENKGLSQKTIKTHATNVEFYINDYLGYDLTDVSEGCHRISIFLGYWFITKAAWSSCAHIKSYASSLKKFYAYLLEENVVGQEDYDNLCETIKERMPDWLEEMKRYEDWLFEDYG